jgi:general secretion pathway protein B
MSILLEALRKSEEQRQLGKTPNIHSPASGVGDARAGAQQWIPLTLIAVSAIAMAWIGWQQYRLPAAPAAGDAVAEVAAAGVPVEPESGSGPAAVAERPGAAGGTRPQAETRPGEGTAETPTVGGPQVALRTPVESFRPETKALRNATVMPPDVRADGQPAEQADPAPGAGAARPRATGPAAGEAVPEVAEATQSGDPAATEAQPRQSRVERHVTEPISFWELPQGIRDSLPELHVTVLVYAERPEDRFVLVSGQRLVEKDEYEGGVVLEEIRRDGAVFQYRNYRFLVKG